MHRYCLLIGLAVGVVGCGARGEVAKEQMLAQVDRLLGEIDVKKKEVAISVRNHEAGIDTIKRGKIEAKVRLAQITEKLSDLQGQIGQADKALGRLRDHLKAGKDAEINGKKFTDAELKDMAERTIAARKKLATEADALKSSQQRLQGVVTALEEREQDGRERLTRLKRDLDEIDAKSIALKSMQDSAKLSGGTETVDFDAVEKQVRDLATKIDVELTFQEQKGQEAGTDQKSLESIVRETSTATDTVAEIDKILDGK